MPWWRGRCEWFAIAIVVALDGSVIPLEAHTICLHGDTPGAAELARAVRAGLQSAGVTIQSLKP